MARWEAYMLLCAFRAWDRVIASSSGAPLAVGDALGMLHGAVKFKSKDPAINCIFMELALLFAPRGGTLSAVHFWSEENDVADDLSRLEEGAAIPAIVSGVRRTQAARDGWRILGRTPTPPRRYKATREVPR